ncbi:lysophospholipid acyltransferase family protein [Bacteroidota bacterium]
MAIIKSKHIWLYEAFFRFYTRRKLKRHFNRVYIEHDDKSYDGPILLLGNHFSWWDGFVGYFLNYSLFKKRYHVMMLEEQLENRLFLNKVGAFSIKKSSRSLAESLAYSSEILEDKRNLLLLFPQGRIETLYKKNFSFERGIEKVLKDVPEAPHVFFLVNLVDYFSKQKPSLFVRTKKYEGAFSREVIQEAYNRFFEECVARQAEKLI